MKKIISTMLLIIMLIAFYACPYYPVQKYNYPTGYFPNTIISLEKLNSEFDDINMNYIPPEIFAYSYLIFSSNSKSKGGQFDLKAERIKFKWDKNDGSFSIENDYNHDYDPEFMDFENILYSTRTEFDEYGPSVIINNKGMFLFYSNNEQGNLDVKFSFYESKHAPFNQEFTDSLIKGVYSVPFLSNSKFNEGYLTFQTVTNNIDQFYRVQDDNLETNLIYCSDSLGQYDIFSIDLKAGITTKYFSTPNNDNKEYLSTINSDFNDRCPNVNGNFMVFSSDRPGGLGGYDFYYSIYENGKWSDPINFGAPVNSEYDEYRAITLRGKTSDFENDLLIFSSNRSGGKGGYDIYCGGINVMP